MLEAGWQALERDDLRGAEAAARRVLAASPADVEAARLLGTSLLFQDRFGEALAHLKAAHEGAPRRGSGHRLGYCHLALGDLRSAEAVLRAEVQAHPDLIDARNALGVALVNQGRPHDALEVFLDAARVAPHSAEACNNAANLLSDLGRHEEAIGYLRQALAAKPDLAETHHNLGMVYQVLKRHDEAIACLARAAELSPRGAYTLSHLVWSELSACRWRDLDRHVAALREQVRAGVAAAPFTFLSVSGSPEEQRRCAEAYLADKLPSRPAPLWRGERYRHERIRVAYLSADFREHATAQLAIGLFETHDRSRFEVTAVSYGPDDGSPMRRRLEAAFERFVDATDKGDEEAAALLRAMEADIVVDLKGYTADARIGILAQRPAPVQVSWLGYPGTSGADFIDYLVADRVVVPAEEARFYSEKLAWLPHSYQVNDGARAAPGAPPDRAAAGLPEGAFVFCSFNNNYKITPAVFDVWMRLLAQAPGSVLWLLEDSAAAREGLRREAQARGIDPGKLVFAPRVPHTAHLARHALADLFLDTQPCNAHTTASDALWAGVPVLTARGATFAGRVAESLLRAAGMPELVAPDLAAYEALALKLARERWELDALRGKLAANRGTQPLFDTGRFRRHLEAAYLAMHERAQRGEAPRAFSVDG